MWRNLRGTFWLDSLEGRGLGVDMRMAFIIYVGEMAWTVWACVKTVMNFRIP
jgi:hypothetical protein